MKALIVEILVEWPMPVIWLLVLGGLARILWRRGQVLIGAGVGLLVAFSLPVVVDLAGRPLTAVSPYDAGRDMDDADAIVVPLAGSFGDQNGRWWAQQNSILRVAAARKLQTETGLPLFISGGVPVAGATSEARATAETMGLPLDEVRLEETAVDTAATGLAIARLLAETEPIGATPKVILVTSSRHLLRSAASLRRHGLEVVGIPVFSKVDLEARDGFSIRDVLPNRRAVALMSVVFHEYVGIAWYLMTGLIRPADLFTS
ncbi:MAG: YdcF family protein [Alphaproteobacteria bacterium]|nr:YdcF family protein [Alphaproteobacteria bacterium]